MTEHLALAPLLAPGDLTHMDSCAQAHPFPPFGATLLPGKGAMADSGLSKWARPSVLLVATDLSDLDRLMSFALVQAHQTNARIILLHVLSPGAGVAADAAGMPYYDPAGAIDFAIKVMEPWRVKARGQEIACDAIVREGTPAQQIIAAARQFNAHRLFLGTRSRSKISKLLLGSVAEQVLRSVNLPVITVGPEAHLPADHGDSERVVLHATTLREASRPSAALACQIAALLHAKLVLLHVLPAAYEMRRKGLPTGMDSAAMQELRTIADETAAGCAVPVEPHVMHGNPAIEILAEASQRRASLI